MLHLRCARYLVNSTFHPWKCWPVCDWYNRFHPQITMIFTLTWIIDCTVLHAPWLALQKLFWGDFQRRTFGRNLSWKSWKQFCIFLHKFCISACCLSKEWNFHFGFVIPNSTNTWQQTIEALQMISMRLPDTRFRVSDASDATFVLQGCWRGRNAAGRITVCFSSDSLCCVCVVVWVLFVWLKQNQKPFSGVKLSKKCITKCHNISQRVCENVTMRSGNVVIETTFFDGARLRKFLCFPHG